ncbi:MAG: hypothetical protein U0W24_00305 [Bacteroidales bacterium]
MIKYNYFENNSLLIIKYSGTIDKESVIKFIEFVLTKTDVGHLEKLISDFRGANTVFSAEDIDEISNFRQNNSNAITKELREIMLVDAPKETALISLFSDKFTYKTKIEVCSTLEHCINYLGLKYTPQHLSYRIETLGKIYS